MKIKALSLKPLHHMMAGLFLCVFITDSMAQSEFQLSSLEQELIYQLDQYREANNLPKLQRAEVLDAVAFDQAEYVAEKGRLVHEQDKDQKKTLVDRLLFYEALNAEAGENLAMISPNTRGEISASSGRVAIESEELLIKAAIYSWVDEEDSKLNLDDPNFYELGVAVHKSERGEFVIAAVFASKPYELAKGVKQKFNFRGIDPYQEENCKEFEEQFGTAAELFSDAFYVEDGVLYFRYHDKKVVEKVLSFGGSAITAEIITDDQFKCGESNRLFPGEVTDGYLMPKISKGSLINMPEEQRKRTDVDLEIGEIPAELLKGGYEVNGIIVQNGAKCATIPYNKYTVKNIRWLNLPFKLVQAKKDSVFKYVEDTLRFSIPLSDQASFEQEMKDIDELLNYMDFSINSAWLNKVSSPISDGLYTDQAIKALSSSLGGLDWLYDKPISKERDWEAYREFEQNKIYQLETEGMDSIAKLNYLKRTASTDEDLAHFMKSLDRLEVQLYGSINFKEDISQEDRLKLLRFLRKRGEMEMALELLNRMIGNKDEGLDKVLSERDRLDQDKTDLPLINNLMVAAVEEGEIVFDGNPMATAFLEIHLIDQSQKVIRYNYLVATLKGWADKTSKVSRLDEWESSFEKLRSFLSPELYAKTLLNFKMIAANYYYDKGEVKEREDAFKDLMKLIPRAKMTADDHYQIAQYLAYQDQSSRAIEALMPVVKADEVALEHLFYFMQLAIYDKELVPDKLFVEILDKTQKAYPNDFCALFIKERMGIQLLKNYDIKERYCQHCAN
jgi:uncharacterized protein YkwD